MNLLFIIPARGGSKGIPYKNIKLLDGKPLVCYSIDAARMLTSDENICLSSDDDRIIAVAEEYGLHVPFKRPNELAGDQVGSYGVLLHAIEFYEKMGKKYDAIVLLQPTSPFRNKRHLEEAIALFDKKLEMVVSVKKASANPYYNCFEEDRDGFLKITKGNGKLIRRQDAPQAWEYNGSVYVISVNALKTKNMSDFIRIKKYVMEDIYSVDIDNMFDWKIAELILKERMVEL